MSEEKGFCVNCNKQDCDLICEGCTERNLLFHENKLISEFVKDLKYWLNHKDRNKVSRLYILDDLISKWEEKLK